MNIKKIYLADLTHTGQSVASNVFPLAVGLLASYIEEKNPGKYNIQLFKYPDDLNEALKRQMPDLVGFSNYSWNCDISYQYAKRIKKHSPNTVVVFGGPNYGLTDLEINDFWSQYGELDFYLAREGEDAIVSLLKQLEQYDFDCEALKQSGEMIYNANFKRDGRIIKSELLPRIKKLDSLGSPYLKGQMDKFFDGILIPMIHTTRGCPFTCTFCTEGNSYYSRVAQNLDLKKELSYIAKRRNGVQDLLITDANFGMYVPDIEKAKVIKEIKEEYDWPQKILVSTGKNKKERILEVAGILDGSLSIAASLQSTNKAVLDNIKRQNISSEALNDIVNKAEKVESTTYTEIILALPGDTLETHIQSLKDVVDSGLGIVRMYQLILLYQTEMSTPESRVKYGFETMFRINPRSFGKYSFLDKEFISVESEEIVVSTNTLSSQDYISAREIDFSVEFVHNTGLFIELLGLCKHYDLSWFDFIYKYFYQKNRNHEKLKDLFDQFAKDTMEGLWDTKVELESESSKAIDDYLSDGGGTNEMVKGKALAFFTFFEEINDIIYEAFVVFLKDSKKCSESVGVYLEQLKQLSKLRKCNFLDINQTELLNVNFDFALIEKNNFQVDPNEFFLSSEITTKIYHTNTQKEMIHSYITQYGKNLEGLGRILMRAPLYKLFRTSTVND